MEKNVLVDMQKSYIEKYLNHNTFNASYNYNKMSSPQEIAKFIRTNNTNLNMDDNLLFNIFKKITPVSKIFKDLLTYEFLFYDPIEKIENIDNLIELTQRELKKYQGKIGGYYIEDDDWILCTSPLRFKIKNNQKILYNSIEKIACYDREQIWFLKKFVDHMKKFVKDCCVKIDYKIIDDENNEICWILLIFEQI